MSTDKIQLYSLATPNGQKIGILLEELGLPYDSHLINISKGEQFTPEFLAINPNNKIPAIVDPSVRDENGEPLKLWESGAILLYLAERHGQFIPTDVVKRQEVMKWLFWQMGGVGPMFGQFGHFTRYATEKIPYAIERYTKEAQRLLGVLEKQLEGKEYIAGDYSIADMAVFPWVNGFRNIPEAAEAIGISTFANINAWLDRCNARPAVQRGVLVCKAT
eukprot:GILI01005291.1.p1 GENE.GILI01005291.1~~GILI01005291.1.p1  ORF type:complete len:234 (-),score=64.65 GILI01005291.1:171-827(-)